MQDSSSKPAPTSPQPSEIPTEEKQNVSVDVTLNVDVLTEEEKTKLVQKIEIQVPKSELKYNLKPQVISENKITFLNAADKAFYERQLKDPELLVWLLLDNPQEYNYTAKRLWECAYRMNIQMKIIETHKLDLIVSQGTTLSSTNSPSQRAFNTFYMKVKK